MRREQTAPEAAGFQHFQLRPELLRAVADAGFAEPRPIQSAAMPPALAGRDVLGLAQTGTGKTAAFVLPILERLLAERKPGPRALVVVPTRELATQVRAEFDRLAAHTRLTSAAVFGGVPIPKQERELARRPDVVVACPGRLLDLLNRRALRLDAVEVLVLDEADHMFDMGFLPDVRRILAALPAKRQNLMYSATMPKEIRALADRVLHAPAVVELASSRPAETISHALLPVAEGQKESALERLLADASFRSGIVFLRTKRRAQKLAKRLAATGHRAVALQGNMSQSQREKALAGFRAERFDVLVATDIAARGLDIEGVSHVVNFDVPNTPDAYTHRIGRTGRSERAGTAFTFVTPADAAAVRAIEKRLGAPIERVHVAGLPPAAAEAPRREAARPHGGTAKPRGGAAKPHGAARKDSRNALHKESRKDSRNGARVHGGAARPGAAARGGFRRGTAASRTERPAAPPPRTPQNASKKSTGRPHAEPDFGTGVHDAPASKGQRHDLPFGRTGS